MTWHLKLPRPKVKAKVSIRRKLPDGRYAYKKTDTDYETENGEVWRLNLADLTMTRLEAQNA